MGLAWQQGPLAPGHAGHFLVADPLPERLLFAEPLRRRLRVRFGETWIAQSDDVVLLHEPVRYPVAYFPKGDLVAGLLHHRGRTTNHCDLGPTAWYAVRIGDREAPRGAWEHTDLPDFAGILRDRVAFAWHAMDAFYEEDERILGHAADAYHRIDIRQTSRELIVRAGERVIAESHRPLVLYESGFAPRWYVPADDVDEGALELVGRQTFCPYKGLCSYYDIGGSRQAAWSYRDPYREVDRIFGLISFEPDKVTVLIDGIEQHLAPGQRVVAHGPDRDLTPQETANPAGIGAVRPDPGAATNQLDACFSSDADRVTDARQEADRRAACIKRNLWRTSLIDQGRQRRPRQNDTRPIESHQPPTRPNQQLGQGNNHDAHRSSEAWVDRVYRRRRGPEEADLESPLCDRADVFTRRRHLERLLMSVGVKVQRAMRSLLGLPASAARAVREQVDRENFARLDASLARREGLLPDIGHELMSGQSVRHVPRIDRDDPLELLWRLPARRPESAWRR